LSKPYICPWCQDDPALSVAPVEHCPHCKDATGTYCPMCQCPDCILESTDRLTADPMDTPIGDPYPSDV
jgi:hypothetical protein